MGRKESEYLIRSTEGLDEKQINEGKRWLSFFHVHDKYHHIGNLEKIDSEAWLDALIEDTLSNSNDDIVNDEDDDVAADTASLIAKTHFADTHFDEHLSLYVLPWAPSTTSNTVPAPADADAADDDRMAVTAVRRMRPVGCADGDAAADAESVCLELGTATAAGFDLK